MGTRGLKCAESAMPNLSSLFFSGFTAWSSERDPSQVFKLLETIYESFDQAARSLGVFKVETIGDTVSLSLFLSLVATWASLEDCGTRTGCSESLKSLANLTQARCSVFDRTISQFDCSRSL